MQNQKTATRKTTVNTTEEIDLLELAKALWKHAWAIIISAVLLAAVFIAYAEFLITPLYSASIMMYVNNSSISVGSTTVSLSDLSAAQSLVDTYLVILKTRTTLEDVIEESGVDYTYDEVSNMIDAAAVNSTEIFQVTVTCANAEDAAKLANTIADVLPDKISSVVDGSSVRVVEHAIVDNDKVSPSVSRYAMMGFLIGFILCCGIIIVENLMDDKIKNDEYLIQTYSVPLLAAIPDLKEKSKKSYGYYGYGYGKSK